MANVHFQHGHKDIMVVYGMRSSLPSRGDRIIVAEAIYRVERKIYNFSGGRWNHLKSIIVELSVDTEISN